MKYILFVIFFTKVSFCFSQVPLESKEYKVTTKGFVYYTNENYLAFVALKNEKQDLKYDDFFRDSLSVAYYFTDREVTEYGFLAILKNARKKFKLDIPWMNSDSLAIIPVKISFIIYSYSYSNSQMKQMLTHESYKLDNFNVEITSVFPYL